MYSQRDVSYKDKKLGKSKLTIGGYGCFLTSLCNLYNKNPLDMMIIPGAITDDGLVVSSVIAKACGGAALATTTFPPTGWCIGMTDHYASQGFPTHFCCVNMQLGKQVDPLDYPANIEPITYKFKEYRPFTNVLFDQFGTTPPGLYPDVQPGRWSEEAIKFCKENGIMKGYDDGTFKPTQQVTREELAVVAMRLAKI